MDDDSKRTAFTNADGSEAGFDLLTVVEPWMLDFVNDVVAAGRHSLHIRALIAVHLERALNAAN